MPENNNQDKTPHTKDDCIFCKFIKGEMPCAKLFESEKVFAFLDIAPNNKGHTLVISKKHHETIIDIPEDELCELIRCVKRIANNVKQATGCAGFNISQNNFKAGGQVIPHIHFHIIPRTEEDNFDTWPHKKYEDGEMEEYRKKIIEKIEASKQSNS